VQFSHEDAKDTKNLNIVFFVPSWHNLNDMSEDILRRLQSRRSFLKGSALLAAAAVVVPASLAAQDRQSQTDEKKDKSSDDQKKDEQDRQDSQDKSKDAPQQEAKEGDGAKTFIGADGRPYRVCPQCGSNMYKQNRTWTCENCGYSYDE
jgi:DNA-directed RNA polymerase subunit M/transcription elongation factor TFIIS